ncbi:MAG: hypothetical protein LBU32_25490 [Clostridiales bacterium]|nr:hypothetical protein [Clostridiales bacterium]
MLRKKIRRKLEQRDELHFDVKTVAFGRRLSHLSITEQLAPIETGAERKQLALYRGVRSYGRDPEATRRRFIGFRPMLDQQSIGYKLDATPGLLEIQTTYGNVQICFDGDEIVRFRGNGVTLRFYVKLGLGECAVDRLDGTCQLNQYAVGEFLFNPIKGAMDFESEWIWDSLSSSDAQIDIEPDESGEFELALHACRHGAEKLLSYRPFEGCVKESMEDYGKWYEMYPPVPGRFEKMKQLCAYAVWVCHAAPKGLMKEPAVLFTKPTASGMFSWHQAYHAMSALNDPDRSVQLMMSFFSNQDEFGEIADIYDDKFNNILATKPPFHGYALLYMMERMGDSLTREHCAKMLPGLRNLYKWWTSLRDTDADGVPQYNHGCESGIDYSDMFRKGVPVEAPDIISYCALLAEALGKLSKRLGDDCEAAAWQEKSSFLIETLVKEFWNGKKFVARLSTSHEIVETDELEAYVPLMLGSRLPKEIVDKMLPALVDPEKYYTPFGFRSAQKSYKGGKPMPGFVGGFAQVKMLPALWDAGEKELARSLVAGYCEKSIEKVPGFGFMEFTPEGGDFSDIFSQPGGELNSLAAAMFLSLAGFLEEISKA